MKPQYPVVRSNDSQQHSGFNTCGSFSYHNVCNGKVLLYTWSEFSVERAESVVKIKTNFVIRDNKVEAPILGPWAESANDNSIAEEFCAQLNDCNNVLKISRDGLCLIYAGVIVSYVSSSSYSIQMIPYADKARAETATTCSSSGKITKTEETSCYTSAVGKLHAGDVVYTHQAQPGREEILGE